MDARARDKKDSGRGDDDLGTFQLECHYALASMKDKILQEVAVPHALHLQLLFSKEGYQTGVNYDELPVL